MNTPTTKLKVGARETGLLTLAPPQSVLGGGLLAESAQVAY